MSESNPESKKPFELSDSYRIYTLLKVMDPDGNKDQHYIQSRMLSTFIDLCKHEEQEESKDREKNRTENRYSTE